MRIGELANLTGVPTSTIRYYEAKGLIPAPTRLASGYRSYQPDAVDRLKLISFSQSLGFSLDELPKLVDHHGSWDHDLLIERLQQKQHGTAELICQLTHKNQCLTELISSLKQRWQQGECMPAQELAELLNNANYQ